MTDKRKPLSEAKAQQQLDQLPPHSRSMLHDQWKRLREIREAPEDIVKGSWF